MTISRAIEPADQKPRVKLPSGYRQIIARYVGVTKRDLA
jgi:hypothetical protein